MILAVNEILAQHEYGGLPRPELFFYSARGKTRINLIVKTGEEVSAVPVVARDRISSYTLKSFKALIARGAFKQITCVASIAQPLELAPRIRMLPFQSLC